MRSGARCTRPRATRGTAPSGSVRATATATVGARSVAVRSREPGPDLLHDPSPAGAEAFVQDYLHRLDRAWTTPQSSLLDNRASKACGTCTNFRDAAPHLARKGQRHAAPVLATSTVSLVIWRPDVRVVADLRQSDHDIIDEAGRRVERVTGGRAFVYVQLTYRGRWWINEVGIDPVTDDGTHRDREAPPCARRPSNRVPAAVLQRLGTCATSCPER